MTVQGIVVLAVFKLLADAPADLKVMVGRYGDVPHRSICARRSWRELYRTDRVQRTVAHALIMSDTQDIPGA